MASPLIVPLAAAAMLLAGCSLDTSATVPPDIEDAGRDTGTGTGDSSTPGDSGDGDTDADAGDSGATDAGPMDSGATDSSPMDSGAMDSSPMDSGPMDSGPMDTGTPDTGTPDTGTPDTGTLDTGTPDTGTADTGTPDTGTTGTCSDLFGGIAGYRDCDGTPTTQCDFRFAHGFLSGSSSNCNDLCAGGGQTCRTMHDRSLTIDPCGRRASAIGCGTNRREAICICAP